MPYRFAKDSWQPARLKKVDHVATMVILIVIAYVRGLDYTLGNDTWASKDFMIAAAPEWVWGCVGFVAGATFLFYGSVSRRHFFVWLGHGWLTIAYGLAAAAQVLVTSPWAFDGIRGAGALGLVASVHLIHVIRTGPAPLRVGAFNTVVSESTVTSKGD